MQENLHTLKSFIPGLKREITTWVFSPTNLNKNTKKIYLQSSLHADELPPMLVLHHLKEKLLIAEKENKLNAQFILVPQANPIGQSQFIGFENFGRFDLTTLENFNRHFFDFLGPIKDEVTKKLTQNADENKLIIRKIMSEVLNAIHPKTELEDLRLFLLKNSFDADVALDLHCDFEGPLHIYTGTPIFDLVKPLAQFMQSHAQMVSRESGGNPFDEAVTKTWWQLQSEFPTFPIPFGTIGATIEFRGKCDVSDEMANLDAENLFQYFIYSDFIKGNKLNPPALIRDATNLDATQFIKITQTGILIYKKTPGDWIKKGESIADILNPLTGERSPVISEVDGQLLTRTMQRWCYNGMYIGKIVGEKSYRTGPLLSAK